jgi:hypothetical protein
VLSALYGSPVEVIRRPGQIVVLGVDDAGGAHHDHPHEHDGAAPRDRGPAGGSRP